MISVLITDDEPLAREGLRLLLEHEPDVKIVGEADDGLAAVEQIKALQPDLVLLDVQVPTLDGFEVLRRIEPDCTPTVIFVTAHDRYAVAAFEVGAVDYLLKPFSEDRFQVALRRARQNLQRDDAQGHQDLLKVLESHIRRDGPSSAYPRWLTVKRAHRVRLIKVDEIDWIDSASNYAQLHVQNQTHLIRITMAELETRLDPRTFVRIHRTTIVNVDRLQEINLLQEGEVSVTLRDGKVLRTSRGFRRRLNDIVDSLSR
jgi:two-component system LytT family response regulator